MQQLLSSGWQFKQRTTSVSPQEAFATPDGWLPAQVPGTIHQDLLAAGTIPDPFFSFNEQQVQWVGQKDWLYRCEFDLPADFAAMPSVDLCFDGLDTFATVWLNGQQILSSDNMFIPQRLAVKSLLKPEHNDLWILFESAFRRGREREKELGSLIAWNGDTSRVFVRKAQYHYGWDWGPSLITAGIWQQVRLEAYQARITELACPAELASDLASATLSIQVDIASAVAGLDLVLSVYDPDNQRVATVTLPATESHEEHTFTIKSPHLWWPNGYGEQARYRVSAELRQGQTVLAQADQRIGLRQLRLVQDSLEQGKTFYFEINHQPIFAGGANWIPADMFIPRVTNERYREWLTLAAESHMTMLRVWGGGIYEQDVFYDLCDELGLMVWQDFMFACGIYPAYDWFLASVRSEAEAVVRRLRHHPSMVLWCGNNEDYQVAEVLNAYDPAFQGDFTKTQFPAREIYERLLPDVCKKLSPLTPYWPGSPYSVDSKSSDPTVGDRHSWEVWHGTMAPYQDYMKYTGRFVSEFGMQAFPARQTVESFVLPEELFPDSATMDYHNKADDGSKRLSSYLGSNLRTPLNLDGRIYATQLIQSEALATAFAGWRRRWGQPDGVGGALVWQLDDCYPVISWAIVDSDLRPKAAYFTTRRSLAPVVVEMTRTGKYVAVWGVNSQHEAINAVLHLQIWNLNGDLLHETMNPIMLPANQALELPSIDIETPLVVVSTRLVQGDHVIARASSWSEPFKHYILPDPELRITRTAHDTLELRVSRPAKGVWLMAPDGVKWSDNFLDLMPGDPQTIVAKGLGNTPLKVRWLDSNGSIVWPTT